MTTVRRHHGSCAAGHPLEVLGDLSRKAERDGGQW